MQPSDQVITDHLHDLTRTFNNKLVTAPFTLQGFLENLEVDSVNACTMLFSSICTDGNPQPSDIWFPNGTTDILLLDWADLKTLTDDPDVLQDIQITTEEACPLELWYNYHLETLIQHCPELDEPDKFPLEPIRAMLRTLHWDCDPGLRCMITQAIRRVFLERTQSYVIQSP